MIWKCRQSDGHFVSTVMCLSPCVAVSNDPVFIHTDSRYPERGTSYSGLILGLRPTNERRRYIVTTSLIGWGQDSPNPLIPFDYRA